MSLNFFYKANSVTTTLKCGMVWCETRWIAVECMGSGFCVNTILVVLVVTIMGLWRRVSYLLFSCLLYLILSSYLFYSLPLSLDFLDLISCFSLYLFSCLLLSLFLSAFLILLSAIVSLLLFSLQRNLNSP